MFPTLARLSKASRLPLTPKRGNKDYYKGKVNTWDVSPLWLTELQERDKRTSPGDTALARQESMWSEGKRSIGFRMRKCGFS